MTAASVVRTLPTLLVAALCGCAADTAPQTNQDDGAATTQDVQVFTSAWIFDGTEETPIQDGVIVARGGVIEGVGPAGSIQIPEGAEVEDLSGRWIVPGLINAHGHVTGSRAEATRQLEQYAHYGVTTVVSLGGEDPDAFQLRDEQDSAELMRARIFVAGPVIAPSTPDEARTEVARIADMGADWVKIRVDDGLDTGSKMSPEVYGEVISAAHERGLPVAVHIVDLEDAIGVVEAGGDLIAHSVRDASVGSELAQAMNAADVCLVPTFTREVSTYVYTERPAFFDDPFFLERAAPDDLESFITPQRQASQASPAAQFYRSALPVAQANMVSLHDAGVGIAMGTDTGPAGRFQGYFEHMEMELMAEAGMEPADVLHAATGGAAECVGLAGTVGTLEAGARADMLVLDADPTADISNARSIHSVWIAGNRIR